jgi:NADPH:quinone reductase-like Zn-dependent oxidoreductase
MVLVRAFGANLQAMARLMAAGKLRSEIEQIYPLAEVAQAQQRSQSWHVRGKLVLQLP